MLRKLAKTTERGYGTGHDKLRARWKPIVEAGQATCARCKQPIPPTAPWDLGHDDNDRTKYQGPEHRACNRGAPSRRRTAPPHSRQW